MQNIVTPQFGIILLNKINTFIKQGCLYIRTFIKSDSKAIYNVSKGLFL